MGRLRFQFGDKRCSPAPVPCFFYFVSASVIISPSGIPFSFTIFTLHMVESYQLDMDLLLSKLEENGTFIIDILVTLSDDIVVLVEIPKEKAELIWVSLELDHKYKYGGQGCK